MPPPWGIGPQVVAEGRLVGLFVGWLSNVEELRAALGSPGPPLDVAAILLNLYRQGSANLARLRGSFVALVWDGDRDVLSAWRDPMGTHALFWAELAGALVISDTSTTLIRRAGVCGDVDRLTVGEFLRYRQPDPAGTFFAAVHRVPPGHTLVAGAGQPKTIRTWLPTGAPGVRHCETAAREFEERMETAVSRCLALGDPAIWLSGGLDSVSVASFAADLVQTANRSPPAALSLGFPGAADEEPVQRSVAAQLGLPLTMLALEDAVAPLGVLEAAFELGRDWPAPLLNPWLPAYLALGRRGVEAGCNVILTGGGGDEWLGVSPYLAADYIAKIDLRRLVLLVRAGRRSFPMSWSQAVRFYLWVYGLRPLLGRRMLASLAPGLVVRHDQRALTRSTPPWLAPDPALRREMDDRLEPTSTPGTFYDRENLRSLDYATVAMENEEFFEASRRLGVPIVKTFLDADLVELLWSFSPEVLNGGGASKGLVRNTLDQRFPELAFGQQKKVEATEVIWRMLERDGRRLWGCLGGARTLDELGVVDAAVFEAALAHPDDNGLRDRWARLYKVPSVELFARAHG